MDNLALLFTLSFIIVAILLSKFQKVGLEKDIIIGTIRAAIQLISVGYILHIIFSTQSIFFIISMLTVMIVIATFNAASKWKDIKKFRIRIGFAIAFSELITMGLIIALDIIEPTAQNIIPISGMIIGNSMVVSGLYLNRLKSEMETKLDEIKLYLSLGATSNDAIKNVKRSTVKASMLPFIDGMKTVGLVQLPGMMTGMIVAGASPTEAVRYQLLIMYSLTAASAITSIILARLSTDVLFNKSHQLNEYYLGKWFSELN